MRNIIAMLAIAMTALPTLAANTVKATVNGMVCAFCAQGIEKKLRKLDATDEVFVSLESKLVALTLKEGQDVTDAALTELLRDAGYTLKSVQRSDTPLDVLRTRVNAP